MNTNGWILGVLALLLLTPKVGAQEPASWGEDLTFHTFSIAAVDPETGEAGVAVTTRNACVGNGVPWVRVGVGAVATQASTRTAYGDELLELMANGVAPEEALARRLDADEDRERRQVGVIGVDGRSAQHTGESTSDWTGQRSGPNYVAQGNSLVGPEVLDAVGRSFEASEGTPRYLADRLIDAMVAGQMAGGDRRMGRMQSAAVIVADPRPGHARRDDGQSVHINVCEHETPVMELRRVYNTISQTLGYRTLVHQSGRDVYQLKLMLHALGYFRPDQEEFGTDEDDAFLYTLEAAEAVDAFREDHELSHPGSGGTPPGLVDEDTVELLWAALEDEGRDQEIQEILLEVLRVTR